MHNRHFVRSVRLEQVGNKYMIRKSLHFALITSIFLMLIACQEDMQIKQTWTHTKDGSFDADVAQGGKFALIATKDKGTQFWNLESNQLLFTFSHHQKEQTQHRLVKLTRDGATAVTLDDKSIGVWNTKTGQSKGYWALQAMPLVVTLSQDARFALIGFNDNAARLIDLETGVAWRSFEHAAPVNAVALSTDERYALVGSDDTAARLWDLNTGNLVHQWFMPFKIGLVAFSPDNQMLLISSVQHNTQIRAVDDGQLIAELKQSKWDLPLWRSPLLTVSSATFSQDSKKLYTGSPPRTIRQWDVKSGRMERMWTIPKPPKARTFAAVPTAINVKDPQTLIFQATDGQGYAIDIQ